MAIDTPYSDIIAHNRGWTEALLADLNSHSTKRLDYIGDMASTLQRLIASGAEITIWPDYDVDGIASGTVLYAAISPNLGLKSTWSSPTIAENVILPSAMLTGL